MTLGEILLTALTGRAVVLDGQRALAALAPFSGVFMDIPPLFGIAPELAAGVAWTESSFRPTVINGIGCVGLMQVCPVNFPRFGWSGAADGFDPTANVRAGCTLLADYYKREGTIARALARYGGFSTWLRSGGEPKPDEYIHKVTTRAVYLMGHRLLNAGRLV